MSHLVENLLRFGAVLRHGGLEVHPGRMLDLLRALPQVGLGSRRDVYHACRALLVHRPEHVPIFDAAFDAFWRQHGVERPAAQAAGDAGAERASTLVPEARGREAARAHAAPDGAGNESSVPGLLALRTWSERSGLGTRDLAAFTPEEMAQARAALAQLVWTPGERPTRRWLSGRGSRIDVRQSIRASLATGGEIVTLARRRRRRRERPLILICDVSRSMEIYSRVLLHFAHALVWRSQRVEVFLFATSLRRVTRALHAAGRHGTLTDVVQSVPDWSGGTRIGAALREFHVRWGRLVLNSGAVVLLISDGWDLGDPDALREQVARLQRRCHRLIWLNPLIGTEGFAPLTRGLRAALPFVDDFLPARTLNNLGDLALHLNRLA